MEESPTVYPLFVGLTRPAMFMGITTDYFTVIFCGSMIVFLVSFDLLMTAGIYGLLHTLGYLACRYDPFAFTVLSKKLELTCPNHHYWGCNSYDPD